MTGPSDKSNYIVVGFYTGEYTGALMKAAQETDRVWYRTYHREEFEAGYVAGAELDPSKVLMDMEVGNALAAAWEAFLEGLVGVGYAVTRITQPHEWQDVVVLGGARHALTEVALRFARTLRHDVTAQGGDDWTFDAFPDAMEALAQLCHGLGTNKGAAIYEDTYTYAQAYKFAAYQGDPELYAWPDDEEVKA